MLAAIAAWLGCCFSALGTLGCSHPQTTGSQNVSLFAELQSKKMKSVSSLEAAPTASTTDPNAGSYELQPWALPSPVLSTHLPQSSPLWSHIPPH